METQEYYMIFLLLCLDSKNTHTKKIDDSIVNRGFNTAYRMKVGLDLYQNDTMRKIKLTF